MARKKPNKLDKALAYLRERNKYCLEPMSEAEARKRHEARQVLQQQEEELPRRAQVRRVK